MNPKRMITGIKLGIPVYYSIAELIEYFNKKGEWKMKRKFIKGDKVRVWSLQSFSEGGFVCGRKARVSQDQTGRSVLVAVKRKFNGIMKIDPYYEVYAEQLKLIKKSREVREYGQGGD